MNTNKVELLAPAGNAEAFYAAIQAGADAVYLGGEKYSARAYADNFSQEELVSCIRYAHIWGKRVYLTINTLMKEGDLDDLYEYLCPLYRAGLDGVIVQDMGAFCLVKELFPEMELHISTQMAVTGVEGARLLRDMGAVRIVPARELTLEEIKAIRKELPDLEIETFIHGAMCYSYSGQCLFSSVLGGRSGNRGRCAQPCRLPYQVESGAGERSRTAYLLSLKDMNTLHRIGALAESGISSFKIEGRMKSPEYAAGVTAIYRKYLDQYLAHPGEELQVAAEDEETLNSLYIRSQVQEGYYFRHNGRDMVTLDSPAYRKTEEAVLEKIRETYPGKRLKREAALYVCLMEDAPASLTCVSGEYSVSVEGPMAGRAIKQPLSEEQVARQLGKLGDTCFELADMNITLGENVFYSLRELNELRREGIRLLEDSIIRGMGLACERSVPEPESTESYRPKNNGRGESGAATEEAISVSVRTQDQLTTLAEHASGLSLCRIYAEGDIFRTDKDMVSRIEALAEGAEVWLSLPYVIRKRDADFLDFVKELLKRGLFAGCLVRNMEGFGFARSLKGNVRIRLDAGLYLWNSRSIAFWQNICDGWCLPLELSGREQENILSHLQAGRIPEKIFYGRTPMMIAANCVVKTTRGCQKGQKLLNQPVFLSDRYGKLFPVEVNCTHCLNVIYNTVPLSLHKIWGRFRGRTAPRLDFTTEGGREMLEVIAYFERLAEGEADILPPWKEYTTGHDKKGVL